MHSPPPPRALRAIAALEALKGALVLILGFGLLQLLGHDTQHAAAQILHRLHLNPASHYPQIFLRTMADITNAELWIIASFSLLYATLRFVEAYGLWHGRRWAEWLAALSGALYIPIEIYELLHHASWLKAAALAVNLAIVAYMIRLLARRRTP